MEWIIVVLGLAVIARCAVGIVRNSRNTGENAPKSAPKKGRPRCCHKDYKNAQKRRERAKDAYYMRNFWNYDGSEQQDWDEEE